MPRASRYLLPSTGEYITSGKVKKLTEDQQVELMRHWFDENYDPPDELPYVTSEGGFQWIWGGPYDPRDAIQGEFETHASDDAIEGIVSALNDMHPYWSGKPEDSGYSDDYLSDLIDSGTDPYMTMIGSLADIEHAAKVKGSEKDQKVLHKLLFANIVAALETYLADSFIKTLGRSDEYTENFVRKTGHFQNTPIKLSDIFDRFRKIDAEVRNFVLSHNWHSLEESGKMYKRAFNIKFPDVPETLRHGIRDRHDIVHRNGKTKEGVEGTWGLVEILALSEAVMPFATAIEDEIRKLAFPAPTIPNEPMEI